MSKANTNTKYTNTIHQELPVIKIITVWDETRQDEMRLYTLRTYWTNDRQDERPEVWESNEWRVTSSEYRPHAVYVCVCVCKKVKTNQEHQ